MKIKKINGFKNQAGATLLEMVMVVGIIAIISVGAVSYYNTVSNSNKVKDEVNNLNSLSAAIKGMFNTQGNYSGLENKIVLRSGSFPDRMRVSETNFSDIKHSWKNNGVEVDPQTIFGSTDDGFSIVYSDVPTGACYDIVQQAARHYYIKKGGGVWKESDGQTGRVQTIGDVEGICGAGSTTDTVDITFVSR